MRDALVRRWGQNHNPFHVKWISGTSNSGVNMAIVTSQVKEEAEIMFAEAFTWFYVRPDRSWRMNSVRWWVPR